MQYHIRCGLARIDGVRIRRDCSLGVDDQQGTLQIVYALLHFVNENDMDRRVETIDSSVEAVTRWKEELDAR